MSKRFKSAVIVAVFAMLSGVVMPSPAHAINIYYWYTPYGSTDLLQTTTAPPNGSFVTSTPGPDYLASHELTDGGFGGIRSSAAGDYCDAYGLPPLDRPGTDPLGDRTGVGMPDPISAYQRQSSVPTSGYNSGCQAANVTVWGRPIAPWGWHVNADDQGNNCSFTCGMQHYVSLAGTADYPWGPAWLNGQLTLHSEFQMNRYITTKSYAGAWAYTCAVLEDVSAQTPGELARYVEYCMAKWDVYAITPLTCQAITLADGRGAAVELVIGQLDGQSPYFQNVGTPTVQSGDSGALGTRHTFEATIGTSNLNQAVHDFNNKCGVNYSTNPANYRLIGLEDGIEGWYFEKLDGSDIQLQAWTAY